MSRTDRPDIINLAPAGSYFGALGTEIRAAVFPESRQMSPVARDEMNQALAEIAANDPHSGRAPKTAAAPEKVDHWAAAAEALAEALSAGTPARDEPIRPRRFPVNRQSRAGYAR